MSDNGTVAMLRHEGRAQVYRCNYQVDISVYFISGLYSVLFKPGQYFTAHGTVYVNTGNASCLSGDVACQGNAAVGQVYNSHIFIFEEHMQLLFQRFQCSLICQVSYQFVSTQGLGIDQGHIVAVKLDCCTAVLLADTQYPGDILGGMHAVC